MGRMRDRLMTGLIGGLMGRRMGGVMTGLTVVAWLVAGAPAWAHPHVWVKVEATLVYENGAFTGIDHKWTFDEAYTIMAVEGLDKNQDGAFDRSELAELAKVNVEALKDFDYFTHPALAGQPVKVGEPSKYWLEHKGGLLALHFRLPFASPVLSDAKGFEFAVYDSSFFIAFELAKTADPVRLSQGAPKSCQLKVVAPKQPDDTAALGALSQMGGVVSIGQTISVACGGT